MTAVATDPTKALPPRRAAFVREYRDLNASRAARDVGYAPKSASVEGSRLLANAEVQAEISRQWAILMEQSNVTPEKIVAELAVIAFSDLGDYIRFHQDGTPLIELGDMSLGATRAIASSNTDATRTAAGRQVAKLRIKLHDKQAALVSLAKMFGLLAGDSPGVSVVVNDPQRVELSILSIEELRAGVSQLGQISGAQALPIGGNEQESPTPTARTASVSEQPFERRLGEASEVEDGVDSGDLASPEG